MAWTDQPNVRGLSKSNDVNPTIEPLKLGVTQQGPGYRFEIGGRGEGVEGFRPMSKDCSCGGNIIALSIIGEGEGVQYVLLFSGGLLLKQNDL